MLRLLKRGKCRLEEVNNDLGALADCVGKYVDEGVTGTATFIEEVAEKLVPKNREAALTALGMVAATVGKASFIHAVTLALPMIESSKGRLFVLKTLATLYSGFEAARAAASTRPPLTEDEYAALLSTLTCDDLEKLSSVGGSPPQFVRAYARTALRSPCKSSVKAEGVKALFTLASWGLMTKEEVAAVAKELGMKIALVRGKDGINGIKVSVSGLTITGGTDLALPVIKGLKAIGAL